MFSANSTSLESLLSCTTHDLDVLEKASKIISSHDTATINQAIDILKNYRTHTLFKFSQRNKDFRELCETHPDLNAEWKNRLKQINYPDFEYRTVDGNNMPNLFQQLMGAFLFAKFKEGDDVSNVTSPILNLACEIGNFDALCMRLDLSLKRLSPHKDNTVLCQQMTADALRLGNLFWTPGYQKAAQKLLSIAYLHNQQDELISLANYYFDAALDALLTAELLAEKPTSQTLNRILYDGQFKNWTQYCNQIMTSGDISQARFHSIKQQAHDKISKILDNNSNHNEDKKTMR